MALATRKTPEASGGSRIRPLTAEPPDETR
jgi:hypothetical protein